MQLLEKQLSGHLAEQEKLSDNSPVADLIKLYEKKVELAITIRTVYESTKQEKDHALEQECTDKVAVPQRIAERFNPDVKIAITIAQAINAFQKLPKKNKEAAYANILTDVQKLQKYKQCASASALLEMLPKLLSTPKTKLPEVVQRLTALTSSLTKYIEGCYASPRSREIDIKKEYAQKRTENKHFYDERIQQTYQQLFGNRSQWQRKATESNYIIVLRQAVEAFQSGDIEEMIYRLTELGQAHTQFSLRDAYAILQQMPFGFDLGKDVNGKVARAIYHIQLHLETEGSKDPTRNLVENGIRALVCFLSVPAKEAIDKAFAEPPKPTNLGAIEVMQTALDNERNAQANMLGLYQFVNTMRILLDKKASAPYNSSVREKKGRQDIMREAARAFNELSNDLKVQLESNHPIHARAVNEAFAKLKGINSNAKEQAQRANIPCSLFTRIADVFKKALGMGRMSTRRVLNELDKATANYTVVSDFGVGSHNTQRNKPTHSRLFGASLRPTRRAV